MLHACPTMDVSFSRKDDKITGRCLEFSMERQAWKAVRASPRETAAAPSRSLRCFMAGLLERGADDSGLQFDDPGLSIIAGGLSG
jgi:hypothetical protein